MDARKNKFTYSPSIKIRVPYFLIKCLYPNYNSTNFETSLSQFQKTMERYSEKILKEISAVFNSEWKEKDIFIYPLPEETPMPSIAFPLLLKLRKNQKLNLYILTHELVHRFIETNPEVFKKLQKVIKEKRGLKMEAFVVFVTQKVFSKLFGRKTARQMREIERRIIKSRDEKVVDAIIKTEKEKFEKLFLA